MASAVGRARSGTGCCPTTRCCSPAWRSQAPTSGDRCADPQVGILTADEVAALDLDGVEWAVLSACDTFVGEIKAGEGVFGRRRAFRIAGARTII